ncbi:MAG: long-chain fatty acid--CoA ligase [Rhodospirillaceae bacterium]|nr:long-chain fatty acid--CoA ligase [Rhodospirillaceae bacterium]
MAWTQPLPPTPVALFWQRVAANPGLVAMREKKLGLWHALTWRDYGDKARAAAHAMAALGVGRGDVSSVLSENRSEWVICDIGAQSLGAIGNGIYTTSAPNQVAYILQDSKTRILFVEDEEQLDKALAVREACPALRHIVVYETEGLRDFSDAMVMTFAEFLDRGADHQRQHPRLVEEEVARTRAEETAILIYTSGTTGPPKAAMIRHANIAAQIARAHVMTPLQEGDRTLSFLPLCHVAERMSTVFNSLVFGNTVHFAESAETLLEDMRAVQPDALFAPPRTWEKMHALVTLAIADATPLQRRAYDWAIQLGQRAETAIDRGARPDGATRLLRAATAYAVLGNLRRFLGLGRLRYGMTGAAPVAPEIIAWFRALGIDLREAYGLTESCGLATVNPLGRNRVGTVGPPPEGIDIALADTGEILIRGANVFAGYLNKPAETAAALDADGWLHTGDVGTVDPDGYVRITDRLKDVMITAGGKNVTPSEIENQLKASAYIADAVVIGDKRPFLSALVMIDLENVARFAQDHRVPFTNYASLCAAEEVQALIQREIETVNTKLARVETIKKFRLIDVLLTPEDDELTPTMKLKRKVVAQKYKPLIDAMYG